MVQTKNEMVGEAMTYVKSVGKTEKEVLGWVGVMRSIKDAALDKDWGELVERFRDLGKVSKELYRWLMLKWKVRRRCWCWQKTTTVMG